MKIQNLSKSLLIIAFIAVITFAARQTSDDIFAKKIQPIFEANCVMCHGAKMQRSGLDLRTEMATLKGGTRGASIVPGKANESLLIKLITHQEEPAMPMGGKLSDAEIAIISEWINGMKPGAAMAVAEGAPIRKPGYSITAKDRAWWSFVKPVRPTTPTVKNQKWGRNEIDAFVLNKLEANGLNPSPAADPRTLLRRVYFDLIGLPPTPEEMDAFLKNPSKLAYEKVIDKLLASEHYGERWGRHWLDLARYADSGGYEFDYDRPHAWRYRDYVIKSFNEDKPFNKFIVEQLAADLMNPNSVEALIPTGFCRSGPTVDNVANEESRSDEMDDMVSATSTVFMGLTVGCARCHDHKYDPIPTKDYYRMVAVFNSSANAEKPLATEAEIAAHKAANKVIDEEVKPFKAKLSEFEKPIREQLINEKIDFHVGLAEKTSGFGELTKEQFRADTDKRLRKEVNIQAEDIEEKLSPERHALRKAMLKDIDAVNKKRPAPYASAMGLNDKKDPDKTFLYLRGNWRTKGEEVQPGVPTILNDGKDLQPVNRRQQLAEIIASPENPLTARVAVNRIWKYHFGSGLVRTMSDFGATGDRPTHPELLDWLATEFVNRGWSWKQMHKLILTSNTYKQSSQGNDAAIAKDSENRLLWRMNPHRLEAEIIRDSILSVSNKLNPKMYGPGIYPHIDADIINTGSRPRWPLDAKDDNETNRRSIYIFVKRSVPLPLIEVFDCPVTVVSAPNRSTSTVSPQALALMNNEFVLEQSRFLAERVTAEAGADTAKQINRTFQITLNRKPSPKELEWATNFIKTQTEGYEKRKAENAPSSALRDFCHAVINLNEFLYVD